MNLIKYNVLSLFMALVLAVFCFFTYTTTSDHLSSYTCDSKPIVVQAQSDGSHQTLYGLAKAHCLGNISEAVNDLVDIYGVDIRVGQRIFLPTNKDCHLRISDSGDVFEEC
jgi:hypothetical protein